MKKKKVTSYTKALERMERETNRAIAHVKLLDELYKQSQKEKIRLLTKSN